MKTKILQLAVLLLFALGCTEEVIKIQKEIVHDTVTQYKDRVFAGLDTTSIPVTVSVPVPTPVRSAEDSTVRIDTVWVEKIVYVDRVDSIFVIKTVIQKDTVVQRIYEYGDTLFQYGIHNTYDVDPEVQPVITEFYKQAFAHGKTPNGGEMIVKVEKMDAVLQAYGYDFYGQVVIKVNSNLTKNERMIPVWREMARLTLGKEYSQDPSKLMYPFHEVNLIRWDNRAQYATALNEFFN